MSTHETHIDRRAVLTGAMLSAATDPVVAMCNEWHVLHREMIAAYDRVPDDRGTPMRRRRPKRRPSTRANERFTTISSRRRQRQSRASLPRRRSRWLIWNRTSAPALATMLSCSTPTAFSAT